MLKHEKNIVYCKPPPHPNYYCTCAYYSTTETISQISSYYLQIQTFIEKQNKRYKDLGALLDSCSWDEIGNFLQTCIKKSLLQTKSTEIWVNSHTVPHYACINLRSYSNP